MKREIKSTSAQEFKEAVTELHAITQKFKYVEARFAKKKKECVDVISRYFDGHNVGNECTVDCSCDDNIAFNDKLVVRQMQKTSVRFDADKIERILGKDVASKVIRKEYGITDMDGLIEYLKSCNVSPKIFKSYINVTKTVDQSELDRLEELGQVDIEDIKKCCIVEVKSAPYYIIKAGKGYGEQSERRQRRT